MEGVVVYVDGVGMEKEKEICMREEWKWGGGSYI